MKFTTKSDSYFSGMVIRINDEADAVQSIHVRRFKNE